MSQRIDIAEPFVIHNALLVHPSIYTGRTFGPDTREKFNTVFDIDDAEVETMLQGFKVTRRGKDALFTTNSIFAPVVTEVSEMYPTLLAAYEKAEVRNLPLNALFRGVRADIVVRPYRTSYMGQDFYGLALLEVRVKARDIQDAANRSKFNPEEN